METQLTIRLPVDLAGKIREKARRMRLKRSDIVRMALTGFLEGPEDTDPPYERVKRLLGSISTGVSDLGARHREHLIKKFKSGIYSKPIAGEERKLSRFILSSHTDRSPV